MGRENVSLRQGLRHVRSRGQEVAQSVGASDGHDGDSARHRVNELVRFDCPSCATRRKFAEGLLPLPVMV